MPGYDAFQQAYQQAFGRPATQEELNSTEYLSSLSLGIIRHLPLGRLESFPSGVLVQMDNADLFNLIRHNPNVANQIPGSRLTRGVQGPDGQWSGGMDVNQLNQVIGWVQQKAPNDAVVRELQGAVQGAGGAPAGGGGGAPAGGGGGDTGGDSNAPNPTETLAREQWEAELANQPGHFYNYAMASRGSALRADGTGGTSGAPVAAVGREGGSLYSVDGQAGTGTMSVMGAPQTEGAPGYGEPGNPWANAGDQIVNQQRPNFTELRGQLQGRGMDVPPGVLNPIIGQDIPTYQSQGGIPLFAPQTLGRMTPSERELLGVTVNRTGGRSEDFFSRSRQLSRGFGGAPSSGASYRGGGRGPNVPGY